MNIAPYIQRELREIGEAAQIAVSSIPLFILTVISAVVAFAVFMLLSFPAYSQQLLAADIFYLDQALVALVWNLQQTAGMLGVGLMVVYAVLVGVTVSVLAVSIRTAGLKTASGVTGVIPGVVVAGCAGCGAGLLGLLGFAGALSLLPFQGNSIRLVGLLILLFVLARIGDPRECRV